MSSPYCKRLHLFRSASTQVGALDLLRTTHSGRDDGHDEPAFSQHIEEEDVYKMRELISEKPKDVIQYIEEEGVIKLGEFEIQDSLVFKAMRQHGDSILTMGDDHLDCDWQSFWREVLQPCRLLFFAAICCGMFHFG